MMASGSKPRVSDIDVAIALKLHERVSPADLRLIEACWGPRDLDALVEEWRINERVIEPHQFAWLLHYGLLMTRIDAEERIWIESSQMARDLVRHCKRAAKARRE